MNEQNPWAPGPNVPNQPPAPPPPPSQPATPGGLQGRPMTRRERLEQRMATGEFQRIAQDSEASVSPSLLPPPPAPASSTPPPVAAPNPWLPVEQSGLPTQGTIASQPQLQQRNFPAAAMNPPQPQPAVQPILHATPAQQPVQSQSPFNQSGPIPNLSGPVPRLDPAEQLERQRTRRKKQRRTFVAIVMSLILVSGGGYYVIKTLASDSTKKVEQITDYPGPGQGSVEIVIPQGATGRQMGEILHEVDAVASVQAFVQAFTANVNAASIQPGSYEVQRKMRAADAVALLIARTSRTDKAITIAEGLTVREIVTKLSGVLNIPAEDIQTVLETPESYGLPEQAGGNPEGWLFGAQYNFAPGTTAEDALGQMVQRTIKELTDRKVPEDQWQTVLTKASLVEREGKATEDRRKIAQAIENRLALPMPLQIDAALAYGLDKPGTQLTTSDKSVESPYNLEKNQGLPPTPIAGPSAVSIEAVLNPEPGPWYFWVTVNLSTGETKFAVTYEDHLVNVAELREWQRENGLR